MSGLFIGWTTNTTLYCNTRDILQPWLNKSWTKIFCLWAGLQLVFELPVLQAAAWPICNKLDNLFAQISVNTIFVQSVLGTKIPCRLADEHLNFSRAKMAANVFLSRIWSFVQPGLLAGVSDFDLTILTSSSVSFCGDYTLPLTDILFGERFTW